MKQSATLLYLNLPPLICYLTIRFKGDAMRRYQPDCLGGTHMFLTQPTSFKANNATASAAALATQMTVAKTVRVDGIGLHKGAPVTLVMHPAPAGHGIVFRRVDLIDALGVDKATIPARFDTVTETTMCTTIGNEFGASVATIEHLMAAIAGLAIDNLLVEIDGPEVPMMDGSSAAFVKALRTTGLKSLDAPRYAIRILKPVKVEDGEKITALVPADEFSIDVAIDFTCAAIGKQRANMALMNGQFCAELSEARTFGFRRDVDMLQSIGLALGGSLDNAIVIDEDDTIMNEEGLRFDDEFVRHKALDAVGDLALAGAPILGRFEGNRPGHDMNNRILHALFADDSAYELVPVTAEMGSRLPGLC